MKKYLIVLIFLILNGIVFSQKNAIKINPLMYYRGELPLYYERAINNSFSIETAIGLTFKDYGTLTDVFNTDESNANKQNEQVHTNTSFRLGLRYYTDYVMEDIYFSIVFGVRKFSSTFDVVDNYYDSITYTSYSVINKLTEETNIKEIQLLFGNQSNDFWNSFFIDYYFGAGLKFINANEIVLKEDLSNNISYHVIENTTKTLPALYLGLKVGFLF
jgi:hypothetical protein